MLRQVADGVLVHQSERGQPVVAGFSTHPHWDHLLWHPGEPRVGPSAAYPWVPLVHEGQLQRLAQLAGRDGTPGSRRAAPR
jgi:hypothetical protein